MGLLKRAALAELQSPKGKSDKLVLRETYCAPHRIGRTASASHRSGAPRPNAHRAARRCPPCTRRAHGHAGAPCKAVRAMHERPAGTYGRWHCRQRGERRLSAAEGDALVSEYVSAPSEEARAAVLSRAYRGLVVTQASRESESQSLMTHDGVVDYAS